MKTFFIRHTKELNIDIKTFNKLMNENYIFIHFPYEHSKDEPHDSKSTNPDDYSFKNARDALKTLNALSKQGGYVCAEYYIKNGAIVGKIEAGTKINLLKGKWGDRNPGRTAVLKRLKLQKVKHVSHDKYLMLSAGRPQRGTIKIWKNGGKWIEYVVNDKPIKVILENLSSTQQEVLCSEYLRNNPDTKILPKMESFLMPVGRTLKDIDIVGLSGKNEKIYVQVTYLDFNDPETQKKFDKLKKYLNGNAKAILFCNCERYDKVDGVIVYPLEMVFKNYSKSPQGKKWIREIFSLFK